MDVMDERSVDVLKRAKRFEVEYSLYRIRFSLSSSILIPVPFMSTQDYVAKYGRRKALRDKVETYWIEEPRRESIDQAVNRGLIPGPPGSLDASLKKHTTLLNKLKTSVLTGPSDALIKEIDGLTLTKYLEEIVAAVVEGASKGKGDSEVAVDVSQRRGNFLTAR